MQIMRFDLERYGRIAGFMFSGQLRCYMAIRDFVEYVKDGRGFDIVGPEAREQRVRYRVFTFVLRRRAIRRPRISRSVRRALSLKITVS